MSKLGFNRVIKRMETTNRRFLSGAMRLAQQEFKRNFDKEQDSESFEKWQPVLRAYPPPILDVTGKLRAETLAAGNVVIMPQMGMARLTVDPHEEGRNRPYAAYHMEGTFNHPARRFLTQSPYLTLRQTILLLDTFDEDFR